MQIGTPMELYEQPQNLFVAGFIGSPPMNLIHGKIENRNMFTGKNRKALMQIPESILSSLKDYYGRDICLGIRPENINETAPGDESASTAVNIKVTGIEHLGSEILLYGNLEDDTIIARLSPACRLIPGNSATLHFNLAKALFFDAATEEVIK